MHNWGDTGVDYDPDEGDPFYDPDEDIFDDFEDYLNGYFLIPYQAKYVTYKRRTPPRLERYKHGYTRVRQALRKNPQKISCNVSVYLKGIK